MDIPCHFHSKQCGENLQRELRSTHANKLLNLSIRQQRPLLSTNPNTAVWVDSDLTIPAEILRHLQPGPRHAVVTQKQKARFDTRIQAEDFLSRYPNEQRTDLRPTLQLYCNEVNRRYKPGQSLRPLRNIRDYVKRNNVTIATQDKGVGFALLPTPKYLSKVYEILSLPQFKPIPVNGRVNARAAPITAEDTFNRCLRDIVGTNSNLYKKSHSTGGYLPRLYGTVKVHKSNAPLRPILPIVGSIYEGLGRCLYDSIKHIAAVKPDINRLTVLERIRNLTLDSDETWMSADVVSLFTNVPAEESIQICADIVFKDTTQIDVAGTPVNRDQFLRLMRLVTKDVKFVAPDGALHKQVEGVAMGSQLGPALANVFMAAKFDPVAKSTVRFYERYVDDTLMVVKKSAVASVIERLNAVHPNIKVTHELPTNGYLPFLDIAIDGNRTTVYRKPSSTGVVTNYLAPSPWNHKLASIQAHVRRAFDICGNSAKDLFGEIKLIKSIFVKNQWPETVVDRIVSKFREKLQEPQQRRVTSDVRIQLLVLPYLGEVSDRLCRKLRRSAENVRIVFTTPKLRELCNVKAPIEKELRSNLVYLLQCSSCQRRYVGHTAQQLVRRIGQHRSGPNSAINAHGCPSPPFTYETVYSHRSHEIAEAIFIRHLNPSLNRKEEKKFSLRLL